MPPVVNWIVPIDRAMFADKVSRYMAQFDATPQELARDTGIPTERISLLLAKQADVAGDEVLILSDHFKCDFKFFISNEKLAPFEETESLFRMLGKDVSREDRWAIQEFLFLCDNQQFLLSALGRTQHHRFTFTPKGNSFKKHGEQTARALRHHLNLATNSVPLDVFDLFRSIGVHVFRRRLGQSAVSGLFVRHPVAGACVLVNYDEDTYRQRFTVAHEVGHALLDTDKDFSVSYITRGGHDLREVRANTFASRFLVPSELLGNISNSATWSTPRVLELAARMMVNPDTIVFALCDARLLSKSDAAALRGNRLPRTQKGDPELPPDLSAKCRLRKESLLHRGLSSSYVGLAFDAYHEGLVSAGRLAEMLLVSPDELVEVAALFGRQLTYED